MKNAAVEREDALLSLERAGGINMGTGLGNGIRITHTIGTDGEGQYGSFVILSIEDTMGRLVEIPFDPSWEGTLDQIVGSLKYHGGQADRLRRERQGLPPK